MGESQINYVLDKSPFFPIQSDWYSKSFLHCNAGFIASLYPGTIHFSFLFSKPSIVGYELIFLNKL